MKAHFTETVRDELVGSVIECDVNGENIKDDPSRVGDCILS